MKFTIESPHVEMIINDIEETHHAIGRCADVARAMLANRGCAPVSDFIQNDFLLGGLISSIAQLSGRADEIVSKLEKYIDAGLIALEHNSNIPS